jgi:predicted ArsR family transcriptional regulator
MNGVDEWTGLTALTDPSRRTLYHYVRRAERPVSREEAADAAGISRGLAAFHLDKLVEAGLLRARYEAPADRPRGRGRSPKVYEATGDGIAVTIPERRYQLIAEILAAGVAEDPTHADEAATRQARSRGRTIGRALPAEDDGDLLGVLTGLGFEPESEAGRVLLRNCPFHALAVQHTDLVCGLNVAFLRGLLEGMRTKGIRARLAPRPGLCCVELS